MRHKFAEIHVYIVISHAIKISNILSPVVLAYISVYQCIDVQNETINSNSFSRLCNKPTTVSELSCEMEFLENCTVIEG